MSLDCCACNRTLPKSEFAKSQLKKPSQEDRRCKACAAEIGGEESYKTAYRERNQQAADLALLQREHANRRWMPDA
eukprot:4117589-Prymnesium_polylepis.1